MNSGPQRAVFFAAFFAGGGLGLTFGIGGADSMRFNASSNGIAGTSVAVLLGALLMPQPFKGRYTISPEAVAKRPELAAHIGLIAALWADVELRLGQLLASILHSDALVGVTIYMVIKAEPARLAAIEAIAADRLSAEDFSIYKALRKRASATGAQRDVLMHNVWAEPAEKPDSLVLLDARRAAVALAAHHFVQAKGGAISDLEIDQWAAANLKYVTSLMEYQARDFIAIEDSIRDLAKDVSRFASKLRRQHLSPPPPASSGSSESPT